MNIYRKTKISSVTKYIDSELQKREKVILNSLKFVGEECVNNAKTNGNYIDQTGNLRSSIGYLVVNSGKVVYSGGFNLVKQGSEGQSEGRNFAKELIDSKGIVLIVVAGMNYAKYVEANKNVISSAELLAESLVPQLLRQLGFKVL